MRDNDSFYLASSDQIKHLEELRAMVKGQAEADLAKLVIDFVALVNRKLLQLFFLMSQVVLLMVVRHTILGKGQAMLKVIVHHSKNIVCVVVELLRRSFNCSQVAMLSVPFQGRATNL